MQEGVSVSYMFLLMQRRKDIWGTDAEEFRPERWLVDDMEDKDRSPEHAIRFMPFNAGPRTW
jgi:cytochrome P450